MIFTGEVSTLREASARSREFRMMITLLGFLLGLMTTAADLSGYLILRYVEARMTLRTVFAITCIWSFAIAFAIWSIHSLVFTLITLTSNESIETLQQSEEGCLLWIIVGMTIGYSVVDYLFSSHSQYWMNLIIMAVSICIYKLAVVIMAQPPRYNKDSEEGSQDNSPLIATKHLFVV
jgi:hypothetical protein